MAATLNDLEAQIDKLARVEIEAPRMRDPRYETPGREYESDEQEACVRLAEIAREIRRIAWAPHARNRARELAARADSEAKRIAVSACLMF